MKTKIKILLFALLAVFWVGNITAYAAEFTLNDSKVTVNVGDTYDLNVTGTEEEPRWTSWDVNKVTVSQNGFITALKKGKTTVSARIGLTVKKCTVNVVAPTIKINKKSAVIYSGEGTSVSFVQLKATVKGANKTTQWTSSNPQVVTVDSTGKVTAVSAGKAIITAKANGVEATSEITVKNNSISLNLDTMQLGTKGKGSSIKLVPTIVGSKKNVKWTTSDKKIASVSGGKVTGKGTGTAVIMATVNGVSATCTVNVIKDAISIESEKEILYTQETKRLKSNAGKKDVVDWFSSNEKVVAVDDSGNVTAIGAGVAMVTVSSNGIADQCQFVVKDTRTRIGEDIIELKTKGNDKVHTLGLEIIGRKTKAKWTSDNKSVATVNSKGKVTAKKAGMATITVEANGVKDTAIVRVKDYRPTIKLNHETYVLYTTKGNSVTLKATIDGPVKKAVWASSEPKVAMVKNGKVTALKEGRTVITATANGISEDCLVVVKESRVVLETKKLTLNLGETAPIPADVVGANQKITYKSSDNKVVAVKNGILTAKNYGEADIQVTANGVTAVCHVIVDDKKCEHKVEEEKIEKESTCSEEGIKTYTCKECSRVRQEILDTISHTWVEGTRIEAECNVNGTLISTCSVCNDIKQEIINATGHNFGEWVLITTPSDFTNGVEKQYCSKCDDENIKIIPPLTDEPGDKPDGGTGDKPDGGTGDKPDDGTGDKPDDGSGNDSGGVSGNNPGDDSGDNPEDGKDEQPVDKSFTVTKPSVTTYLVGDTLNLTDGAIVFKDGTSKELTESMISSVDLDTPGEKTIQVSNEGESGSFKILVVEEPKGIAGILGQKLLEIILPQNQFGIYQYVDGEQVLDAVGDCSHEVIFIPSSEEYSSLQFLVKVSVSEPEPEPESYFLDFKDINKVTLYYQGDEVEIMDKAKGIPIGDALADYYLEIEPVYAQKIYTGVKEFKPDASGDTISAVADLDGFVSYQKGEQTNDFCYSVEYLNLTGDISDYGADFFASIKANPSGTFTLTEDIDARDITLDGNYTMNVTFRGKLDGNGYTIRNLKAPLFNAVSGGQISNLTIKASTVTGGRGFIADAINSNTVIDGVKIYNSSINSTSASSVGGFGGTVNSTTIKNSAIIGCSIAANNTIGGIVGDLQGGCVVENTVVLSSTISGTQAGNQNGTRGAGIAGWLNATATIRNCFVDIDLSVPDKKGSGGIFGAPINSNAGTVTDCFVKLNTNDRFSICGANEALGKVSNVYQSSTNTTIQTGDTLYSIASYDDDFLKDTIGLSDSMVSLVNSNVVVSGTVASLSEMEGYLEENDVAYFNITKLAPWLDSEMVISLGNNLTGNLATKEIQSIYPMDADDKLVTYIDSNNAGCVSSIRILYTDKSHETLQVIANQVMNTLVDTYTIYTIGIPYHFNKYIYNDNFGLANTLETEAESYTYDTDISTAYSGNIIRQYKYVYENDIADNVSEFTKKLVASEYVSTSTNTSLKSKLETELIGELPKLLYTYTYFRKNFGFEMGGVDIADLIFFDTEILSSKLSLETMMKKVGSSDRGMTNAYNVFEGSIASATGVSLYDQLELFLRLGGVEDYDAWLQGYLDCHIVSRPPEGYTLTTGEYSLWDNLTNPYRIGGNCHILAVLTIPKEFQKSIGMVSTVGTILFTDIHIYYSDPTEVQHEQFQRDLDTMGLLYARYFGTSLGYITNGEENVLKDITYQYDSITSYKKAEYQNSNYAQNPAPMIMWVSEPTGKTKSTTAGAVSTGDYIYYGYNQALINLGLFSHENAHSMDGSYFLAGYGRRGIYDVEFYTEGFFTEPGSEGIDDISATRAFKFGINDEITAALDYERLNSSEEIEDFYKDLFNSGYAFDAMAANALIEGGIDLQYQAAKRGYYITDPNDPFAEELDDIEAGRKIPYYNYWNKEIPLNSYDDLWSNKIVYKGLGGVGSGYERPKFYEINWWMPSNDIGSTDANTFKLMGYEMLGYAGWEEGMIGWASGKYASDEDAIQNITGYSGMEEYKKARFSKAFEEIKKIPYFDNERMEEIIKKVMNAPKRTETPAVELKTLVISNIKRVTDDFTDGNMYEMTENNKYTVSTAQELVDVINTNSMKKGVYIELSDNLDFSDVAGADGYYAEHFIGIINGNGYSMNNLSKPLCKSTKFSIFYDIDFEGTASKYLANTARYALAYDCSYNTSGILFEAASGDSKPGIFTVLNNQP